MAWMDDITVPIGSRAMTDKTGISHNVYSHGIYKSLARFLKTSWVRRSGHAFDGMLLFFWLSVSFWKRISKVLHWCNVVLMKVLVTVATP